MNDDTRQSAFPVFRRTAGEKPREKTVMVMLINMLKHANLTCSSYPADC